MISKKKAIIKTKLNGKKTQKTFTKRRKIQRILNGGAATAAANNASSIENTSNSSKDFTDLTDIGIKNGESLLQYLSKDEYRTYFDDTNPKPIYSDHAPVVYTIPYINEPEKQKRIITWNVAKYGNSIIKDINSKKKKLKKDNPEKTLITICPDGKETKLLIDFAHKFNGGIKGPFKYCELNTLSADGTTEHTEYTYYGNPQEGTEMHSKYLIRLGNIADAINTIYKDKEYDKPIIMLQELPNNQQDMNFFIEKLNGFGLNLRIEKLPVNEEKKDIIIKNIENNNPRLLKIPIISKRENFKKQLQEKIKQTKKNAIAKKEKKNRERNPEFPYENDEDYVKIYNEFGIIVEAGDNINFNYDIDDLNDKIYKCMEDKTKKDIIKRYSIYLNKENEKNIYYVCLHCFSDTEESLIQMLNNIIECTIQVTEEKTANNSLNILYPNQFIFAGDFNKIMHNTKVLTLLQGTNQKLYTNKDGKGNNLSDNKGNINPKGNIDLLITTDILPKKQ
jgi:L-rhamnose mutarotase